MQTEYKVVFNYHGNCPSKIDRTILERAFMIAYNSYCEVTNSNLEKWNDQYTGPLDGDDPKGEYCRYIREKFTGVTDALNWWMHSGAKDAKPWKKLFQKFFINEDDLVFTAMLTDGTIMGFCLK